MKVTLNKQLIIENGDTLAAMNELTDAANVGHSHGLTLSSSLDKIKSDANIAASHGTHGVPTITDGINKVASDMARIKQNSSNMSRTQVKEANMNTSDLISQQLTDNYKKRLQ